MIAFVLITGGLIKALPRVVQSTEPLKALPRVVQSTEPLYLDSLFDPFKPCPNVSILAAADKTVNSFYLKTNVDLSAVAAVSHGIVIKRISLLRLCGLDKLIVSYIYKKCIACR